MPKKFKNFVAAAIVPILLTASIIMYIPPRASAALSAKTTDYLNLRKGAGTNTGVILTLSKNVSVTVIDNSDAQWAKVHTQSGKEGYCFKQYLNFAGSTTSSGQQSTAASGSAVATANLNMRASSSLSGHVILILSKGTSVKILDNSNANWAKVQTNSGRQGYCYKKYLKVSGKSTNSTSSQNSSSGLTASTTDYLNLRSGAGTSYKIILTMGKGSSITVLDNSNSGWAKVRTQNGVQGWCSKQYLNIAQSGSTSSSSQSSSSPSVKSSSTSVSTSCSSSGGSNSSSSSSTHTITGATVTASMLRLREQPNTNCSVLGHLAKNTVLKVLDTSVSGWIKVETSGGKIGYVSADYVKLNYSDDDNNTSSGSSDFSISASQKNIPLGKTLYLKVTKNASGGNISWTSSDTSVASVTGGLVCGVKKGEAVITASNGSSSAECKVNIQDAEPVRTAYASPNVAAAGETVTFTAITDSSRDGVKFIITAPSGSKTTVTASNRTNETVSGIVTKDWSVSTVLSEAGEYSVAAYSSVNGTFSPSPFNTNAYVTSSSDTGATSKGDRHVSDKMISLIAKWEGCRSSVEKDKLTYSQVPTIGYGCTLSANALFYDSISNTEALSEMINKINNSSYTSELNKMVKNNNFLISQEQADCLISFAYNVGPKYFNSSTESDFRQIMKNSVVPPDFSSGKQVDATVTKNTVVRSNSGIASNETCAVNSGTAVTVIGSDFTNKKDGWYNVRLSNGTEGWINSGYVSLSDSENMVHDLNYTNAYAFGTEFIRWSLAGGKFYTGLFYRRLGEANVYNYGDYNAVKFNKYGYGYPSSASSLS